ncbi:MAG: nucleotide sugar dehydrogenase [Candidatus Helarchaeota archaeon]|nr:nucleotide sugar dehydrogenase [Candidatus Helarchaeota archaeon]
MDDIFYKLKEKIKNRKLKIAVIGLGYVGLPLAVEFTKNGYNVVGIEKDEKRMQMVNKGYSYIEDVNSEFLKDAVNSKKMTVTNDYSALKKVDCINICVPTPLGKTKAPDISYVLDAAENIQKYLSRGQLIFLESTTYPGTTRELVMPILERSGLKTGRDFFLVYSPERIDPGNKIYNIKNIPKILGGITRKCTKIGKYFYLEIIDSIVEVSSTDAAEMVKLLENTFRSVNIALVNEVAIMCDRLNLNIWEIIDSASTKPFGYMKFYPGPGLGGHCLPVDPHYLSWKLKSLNYRARFIEIAGEINSEMPLFVINKIIESLNRQKKSVNGSKILLIGISYKRDVSDIRESPALDILNILEREGASVYYHDPLVSNFILNKKEYKSKYINENLLKKIDCAVIITDHSNVNYRLILDNTKIIVDTRNAYKGIKNRKVITL